MVQKCSEKLTESTKCQDCQDGQKKDPHPKNTAKLRRMLPKLYEVKHPRAPYLVVFTTPEGKRVRRNFKDKTEAQAYHRQLLTKAKTSGTAGLVLDAEMRAEYFAAKKAMNGRDLMEAVRF